MIMDIAIIIVSRSQIIIIIYSLMSVAGEKQFFFVNIAYFVESN